MGSGNNAAIVWRIPSDINRRFAIAGPARERQTFLQTADEIYIQPARPFVLTVTFEKTSPNNSYRSYVLGEFAG
jgi:hypothetical protein